MRYAIYVPPNAKDNRPYDACLWKPAERNKVCMSKQIRFVVRAEIINGNQALDVQHC